MTAEHELGIDIIHNEPAEETLAGFVRTIERFKSAGSDRTFSMFYIAGVKDKTQEAIDQLAGKLGVSDNARIELDIDPAWAISPKDQLINLFPEISLVDADTVLAIARGFEKKFVNGPRPFAGHNWDQAVLESFSDHQWGDDYRLLGKHIIVVTTIDFSSGELGDNSAVGSAVLSDFKHGILVLSHTSGEALSNQPQN